MKKFIPVVLLTLLVACNNNDPGKTPPATADSIENRTDSVAPGKETTDDSTNHPLLHLSDTLLKAISERDYSLLAKYIHPRKGIRFSPYGFVDTADQKVLTKDAFLQLAVNKKKRTWGTADGSGDAIVMTLPDYITKYVYDHDYRNAKQKSVNRFLGGGNSLNNLHHIYPGTDFTEFYFPGFDPQYGGMDWGTLRLVFQKENTSTYLVAIIHDQWTI